MAKSGGENSAPIIIKKHVDDDHDGHHGGAWKVAYADFVTAMMAFFLLLWILASVEEESLKGIAEHFQPTITPQDFFAGEGVLSGVTVGEPGVMSSSNSPMLTVATPLVDRDTPGQQEDVADPSERDVVDPDGPVATAMGVVEVEVPSEEMSAADAKQTEDANFDALEEAILQAMQENPDLSPLLPNVLFDKTPEGLRIQIVDQEKEPMFPLGSAEMYDHTRSLLALVGAAVVQVPNHIIITGHTDSRPFANDGGTNGYGNWELSADRANATRRALMAAGVPRERFERVSGVAARDPIDAENPDSPINRRMSIVLAYGALLSGDKDVDEAEPAPDWLAPIEVAPALQDLEQQD